MEIKGQIEEIIYSNDANGYTVCNILSNDTNITAVGYLPFVNIGDVIVANGKFITHNTYGEQFKIDTFEKTMPSSSVEIEKYLGSGIIKGVGPATSKKIVNKFGDNTAYILRFEPNKLTEISGITSEKAKNISDEFNKDWELWQIVMFLQSYGVGVTNANRVYKELGINAIDSIKENPYLLLNILYGVDFKTIDKMAINLGIDYDSSFRIASGVKYALAVAAQNGHTCVLEQNLVEYVSNILGVESGAIENEIVALNFAKDVHIEDGFVFLGQYYIAEDNVAKKLIMLCNEEVKKYNSLEDKISEMEKILDIQLSKDQKKAVLSVFNNKVTIITGGPGTGKTTIIKMIIKLFEKENLDMALCAPTGRAAKRITETTGVEAMTLHRLLELGKLDEDFIDMDFKVQNINKDIIIVDEMSMVDIVLMNFLIKGVNEKARLVLIGDSDQLPSVGPGSVLKDLIESDVIPTIRLTEIYRQATESLIITNAHKINNGELPDLTSRGGDFFFIKENNILEQILNLSSERLSKFRQL
jgi:exodeoxyribonuclease V alpha subunit